MQTPAISVWCAMAMAVLTAACGIARSQDDQRNDAHFEALSRCLAEVESEVDESFADSPRFDRIEDAVTWARTNLRGDLGAAFVRAGVTVRKRIAGQDLRRPIKDREQFERNLYSAITAELQKFERCEDETSITVVDKLNDEIYLRLHLGEGAVGQQFAQIGLVDSYEVKGTFLLMMTLDAAGVSWNPGTFSEQSAPREPLNKSVELWSD